MTGILLDLLDDELTENERRVFVNHVFTTSFSNPDFQRFPSDRSKSLGSAKTLREFYNLVRSSIRDMEDRASVPESLKVFFTEEEPDTAGQTETITFSLIKRLPGAFSQGAPWEGKIRNQRPMIREEGEDPSAPGYKQAVHGYWYDNLVRFTCWARTNKAANARIEWFEDLMEEYSWWYSAQGVQRVIFEGRKTDMVVTVDGNKWYGRPADYFVRTEKLRVFSEKKIEEIIINLKVTT
jgi:hypothetical protein